MTLRVGVNLLYLRPGQVGGSEVYVRSLLPRLIERGARLRVLAGGKAAGTFSPGPGLEVVRVFGDWSQRRRFLHENTSLVRHLGGLDVLFSPANFAIPLLPSRIAQVATVHDLQHHWLTANFSPAKRAQRTALFTATLARARRVIAISEFTRQDLLSRYSAPAQHIVTVLEGFESDVQRHPEREEPLRREHGLTRPFVFFPATDNAHKNHTVLIEALARLRETPLDLVLTGSTSGVFEALKPRIEQLGLTNRVHHLGFVARHSVYDLMFMAQALVFPSRFEGFGLPVLEAMQCDTPVIAAGCASIPEIAGQGAILLDPDDPAAWADAMLRVCTDEGLREVLIANGRANLERFSWQRCADETLRVLSAAARR